MTRLLTSVVLLSVLLSTRAPAQDTLVSTGSSWLYLDDGSDQGSAWSVPSFDDSSWSQGPAPLGYGDNDEATVVSFGPSSLNKYPTTYFRHEFSVADPSTYLALKLELQRDDGAVLYLNGVEIRRDNLTSGPVSYLTFANETVNNSLEDLLYESSVDPGLLVVGSNVLAVEIHQRDGDSSDISFELELIGETSLTLRRGPYIQSGGPGGAVVRWRTNVPSSSSVDYGTLPGQGGTQVQAPGLVLDHELPLSGPAGATLYYELGSTTQTLAGGDSEHFVKLPAPNGVASPLRIWAVGDSGTGDANAAAVRDAFLAHSAGSNPDLMLMLGDNAYNSGRDDEYQNGVFEIYADVLRQTLLFATRGNHDESIGVYTDVFSFPTQGEQGGLPSGTESYYSFDRANVHFVCLDSEGSSKTVGAPMWTWLDADLSATPQTWIVAFWHHPPYTKGSHDSDTESDLIGMRQNFLPLLESHGVDLVLCGHSHSYERSYLIDGHYGNSPTFNASLQKDAGDGSESGDGAYFKEDGPNTGAVYCVAGCSGKLSNGDLDHPAMAVGLLDTLGSVIIDVSGERMDVAFLDSQGQVGDEFTLLTEVYEGKFCVSKPTGEFGCLPTIQAAGVPSASDPSPFTVSAFAVVAQKPGLMFFGLGGTSIFSFGIGGTLCVKPPLGRTPLQFSGGSLFCDGAYALDFNTQIQSGVLPQLAPGALIAAQYWFRDPADTFGTGLTDAVQFVIQP